MASKLPTCNYSFLWCRQHQGDTPKKSSKRQLNVMGFCCTSIVIRDLEKKERTKIQPCRKANCKGHCRL